MKKKIAGPACVIRLADITPILQGSSSWLRKSPAIKQPLLQKKAGEQLFFAGMAMSFTRKHPANIRH
jgi:hypothetical protein